MIQKLLLSIFVVAVGTVLGSPAARGQVMQPTTADRYQKEDDNEFYAGLELILGTGSNAWNLVVGYRQAEIIADEVEGMDLSFAWRLSPWRYEYTLLKDFKGDLDRQKEYGLGYNPHLDGMIFNYSTQRDEKNFALRYAGGLGTVLSLNLNTIEAYLETEKKPPAE